MLTPDLLDRLRSDPGRKLLEQAGKAAEDPFIVERLRREWPFELAAAAVEQVRLRKRAGSRFSRAEEMWFAPGLLEQASGEVVSRHRGRRFHRWTERASGQAGFRLGDFCSGLGADAVLLAEVAAVAAVDRDPLAVALTRANAAELGVGDRVEVFQEELPGGAPPVAAAWIDPGRREGGRRTRRLEAISPALSAVLSLREQTPHLGIKLSPASAKDELDAALAGIPHEREFLSVSGELRELAVWTGDLAREEGVRATVLPEGGELAGVPARYGEVRPPSEWLLEPDPAVIRAGLVANLAETLRAWPLDGELAYLSLPAPCRTPFGTLYRVEQPEPFSARSVAARLRAERASDVVFKTRGAAVEPEALRVQMRGVLKQGEPGRRPVVFITRLSGRAQMMLGERFEPGLE